MKMKRIIQQKKNLYKSERMNRNIHKWFETYPRLIYIHSIKHKIKLNEIREEKKTVPFRLFCIIYFLSSPICCKLVCLTLY